MRPRPRPAKAKPAAPLETTAGWGFLFIFMSRHSPSFSYRCHHSCSTLLSMSPPATAARAQEARRQVGRLMRGRTPQALFSQSSLCMNPPYFLHSAYGINHPRLPLGFGRVWGRNRPLATTIEHIIPMFVGVVIGYVTTFELSEFGG